MELKKTGHTVIDMQHNRILDWFEKLSTIPANQRFGPYANAVLQDLQGYIQEHFEQEEAVMVDCGFPGLERHRHLHAQLESQVKTFAGEYHQTGSLDQDALISMLRDWLVSHINCEDVKLARFIEEECIPE